MSLATAILFHKFIFLNLQRPADSALLRHLYVLLVHRLPDHRHHRLDRLLLYRQRKRSLRRENDPSMGPQNGRPLSRQEAPLRGENPNSGRQNPERDFHQPPGPGPTHGDICLESLVRPRHAN